MRREADYHLVDPTWCPGCGLYGVFAALKKASVTLDMDPDYLVIVTGIGCHGRFNNYFKCYGFHALHGRALPVASGARLANQQLTVVAVSGDGDAYSIGLGHFIHAIRRNINMTYIVVDNRIFALTQGQTSPTSQRGFVSISTPYGSIETPINGIQLALASGGTFVARGFSGDPNHLAELLVKGIRHEGFSLVEVMSPCVTHNKIITYEWFKKNIEKIDADPDYDCRNKTRACERLAREGKIPYGLIYQEDRPSFESLSSLGKKPLAAEDIRVDAVRLNKILDTFNLDYS